MRHLEICSIKICICHFSCCVFCSQEALLELRMLISVNHHSPGTPSALLSSTSPEQQGNAEDGRLPHRALARHRKRWQQHQEGDGGDGLPHPFSRLQQEQPGGEKQPGPLGCGRHTNLRRPQRRPVSLGTGGDDIPLPDPIELQGTLPTAVSHGALLALRGLLCLGQCLGGFYGSNRTCTCKSTSENAGVSTL